MDSKSLRRTVYAKNRIGLCFQSSRCNGLTAHHAGSVAAVLHSFECIFKFLQLGFLPSSLLESHLLHLHRIEPRQSADGNIGLNGFCVFGLGLKDAR